MTSTPHIGARRRDGRIPRSCSDVFRLWAAMGLGALLTIGYQVVIVILALTGVRTLPEGERLGVEFGFGSQLVAWNGFAVAYLLLGVRAFAGVDRAELVRRVLGSPPPRSRWRRWVLAGGGGPTWSISIAIIAFGAIVVADLDRANSTKVVFGLTAVTVLTCLMVITFSFALFYARRDIEQPGLEFSGRDELTFSDYVYLAIGCSVTFGTTDTAILTSSLRRTISIHSVLAFLLNTVVIAVLLSLLTG